MRLGLGLDCYKIPLSEELWFTDGKDKRIAEIIESTTPMWSPESKREFLLAKVSYIVREELRTLCIG